MKNLLLLAVIVLLAACGQAPAGEKVEAEEAKEVAPASQAATLNVVTNESTINWEGSKLLGDNHLGTIGIKEGTLSIDDSGQLSGGSFVIDMTSMKNTDLPADKGADLVGHLSSGDFFEVEKYPTAEFNITSVEPSSEAGITHKITGNLKMKEDTKSITIPANVKIDAGGLKATTPQFVIDRTAWKVMYGAGALGLAKDKVIKDEIGLALEITASK